MTPAGNRAPKLIACLSALAALASAVAAGDNAGVAVGLRKISEPCGRQGGQQVEFAVLAGNMVGVAQVAIRLSWMPSGAVSEVAATLGPLPEEVGLIAPFSPLITGDRAEFGMASLGNDSMDGEGELVRFQLQLAPQVTGNDQVEIWVDAVSVGPSFTELDVILPLQAVVLTNFCDDSGNPLEQVMLVSAEEVSTDFSPPESGAILDGSAGEKSVRARLLRQVDFAVEESILWTVSNSGDFPLFIHADAAVHIVEAGGLLSGIPTSPDLRGNTFLILDVEGTLAGGRAAADISACDSSANRCATTRTVWDVAATAVNSGSSNSRVVTEPLELGPNFPNPFNPTTTIPFTVPPGTGVTSLEVFNGLGQLVATLVWEKLSSGHHVARWNGRTSIGGVAASGVYFLRLQQGVYRSVRPMVLAR